MSIAYQPEVVENFFAVDVAALTEGLARLESEIDPNEQPTRNARYRELLDLLDQIRSACKQLEGEIGLNDTVLRDVQQRFQEVIAPWFSQSWMMNHARTKPQGYAGDYQMLTTIYEAQPRSSGLGGYLDLFFLDTELGRAVPARKNALQRFLSDEIAAREGDVAVVDIACGPCREFADGIEIPAGKNVRVTFVDYDEDSLSFAERALSPAPEGLAYEFVRYNALRMQAPAKFIAEHGKYDVVYSVGLCDYLNDRQLIAMFKGWREMLKAGGVLYVAFKDMNCYDKTDYQWLVDWFFLEREEEDCRQLFLDAGYKPEELTMERDATGIIMNFAARAVAIERVDAAHVETPRPASVDVATPAETRQLN
ncbi:MAG: methyltransferase domain-containing protein [Pirellulales bacterium]|nr:methyltransferase domain-containing protein [Pirellulales bacterium]